MGLIFEQVWNLGGFFSQSSALFTTVARNKTTVFTRFLVNAEIVDGEQTVIRACFATHIAMRRLKRTQGIQSKHGGLSRNARSHFLSMSAVACQQGSTICTHVSCNIGTNCIGFSQLLKCAQNGIIQERAALNNNLIAHFVGIADFNYLEQGIFDNGKSQASSDVTNRGTFLLSLLNATVHEHRTTAAQINRIFSLDSALSEFGNIKIQARCKALDK